MTSRALTPVGLALSVSLVTVMPATAQDDTGSVVLTIYLIFAVFYLIPTFVAFWRRHPNRWVILILNVMLGGTGIVWLGCLVWAFKAVHITDDPSGTHGGESGLNLVANDVQRVRIEGLPPPLPPKVDNSDPIDRLERLKRLLDDGVIDVEQFHRIRNRVIGGEGESA